MPVTVKVAKTGPVFLGAARDDCSRRVSPLIIIKMYMRFIQAIRRALTDRYPGNKCNRYPFMHQLKHRRDQGCVRPLARFPCPVRCLQTGANRDRSRTSTTEIGTTSSVGLSRRGPFSPSISPLGLATAWQRCVCHWRDCTRTQRLSI